MGSNFTYDSTIPAASHNPSTDQPTMQNNYASIAGLIAEDHVGFNTSDGSGGNHLQVTFNSNNVPGIFPVSPPVLFTNNVNALPQLFFYSGSAAQSSNQYSIQQNGSALIFGGIILKWGAFTMADNMTNTGDITFGGGAFQSNLFSIVISGTTPNSGNTAGVNLSQTNLSKFQAFRSATPAQGSTYYYVAIGN